MGEDCCSHNHDDDHKHKHDHKHHHHEKNHHHKNNSEKSDKLNSQEKSNFQKWLQCLIGGPKISIAGRILTFLMGIPFIPSAIMKLTNHPEVVN
jgi:hypothetical protein